MATHPSPHVVIIGGGITGLSAGYYLDHAARARGTPIDYTIVEQSSQAGGKIHSDTIGALVIESGADSFLTQKPWAMALVHELGLADDCVPIASMKQPTYVLVRGKPEPMTPGMVLGIPTQIQPFLRSALLSPWGKLRVLADLAYLRQQRSGDESLAAVMTRHFGHEMVDRLIEPLMSGIHNSLAAEQSLLATFPRFRESERNVGSLIRGAMRARAQAQQSAKAPPPPAFVTLRGGMGQLIDALVATQRDHLRRDCGVTAISYDPGAPQPYRLQLATGETLAADALIMTTPAFVTAALVADFHPNLAADLRAIRYVSTGTISLAYASQDVGELPGFGVLIPRSEGRQINAITISSRKFAHRAPTGTVLVRAFIGGSRFPDAIDQPDATILRSVRQELQDILGIRSTPRVARIWRLRDSSPQYDVGHEQRIDAIDALCPPDLVVAGSAYRGVGIPDCIKQAQDAAATIMTTLQLRPLVAHGAS